MLSNWRFLWFRLVSVLAESFGQFLVSVSVSEPKPKKWFRCTQVIFPPFEYTPKRYITYYITRQLGTNVKRKKIICAMCLCKNYLVFSCIKFKANIKWWNKMKLERILSETNFPDSSNSSLEQPVLVHCLLCLSFS